ncbi:MAG: hypothetical protein WKG07_14395 [Hymenobacter sp.]
MPASTPWPENPTQDGATVHVLPGNAGIPNSHPRSQPARLSGREDLLQQSTASS